MRVRIALVAALVFSPLLGRSDELPAAEVDSVRVLLERAADPFALASDIDGALDALVARGPAVMPAVSAVALAPGGTAEARRQALAVAVRIGGPHAADLVGALALNAHEPELRGQASLALLEMGEDIASAYVPLLLADPSTAPGVLWALATHPLPGTEGLLATALSDGTYAGLAVEALGALGSPEAVALLTAEARAGDPAGWPDVMAALLRTGDPAAQRLGLDALAAAAEPDRDRALRQLLRSQPGAQLLAGMLAWAASEHDRLLGPLWLDVVAALAARDAGLGRRALGDGPWEALLVDVALGQGDPLRRTTAVTAARTLGLAAARQAALDVLAAGRKDLAADALELLRAPATAAEVAVVAPLSSGPDLRAAALALRGLSVAAAKGVPGASEALVEQASAPNPTVDALIAAWDSGVRDPMDAARHSTSATLDRAGSADDASRLVAALARRTLRTPERLAVERLLRASGPSEAGPAVEVLGSQPDEGAVAALWARAQRSTGSARREAVRAMGRTGAPEAEAPLIAMAQDRRDPDRLTVIDALADVGGERAAIALVDLLADSAPEVVAAAARGLSRRPFEPARPALERAAASPDGRVAVAASAALLMLGDDEGARRALRSRLGTLARAEAALARSLLAPEPRPATARTSGPLVPVAAALRHGDPWPLLRAARSATAPVQAYLRDVVDAYGRPGPLAPAVLSGFATWDSDVRAAATDLLFALCGPEEAGAIREHLWRARATDPHDLLRQALRSADACGDQQSSPAASGPCPSRAHPGAETGSPSPMRRTVSEARRRVSEARRKVSNARRKARTRVGRSRKRVGRSRTRVGRSRKRVGGGRCSGVEWSRLDVAWGSGRLRARLERLDPHE